MQHTLRSILVACLLGGLAAPMAFAGNLTALAYQNLGGRDQQVSPGAEVVAHMGQASARATRAEVRASAVGQGTGQQTFFGASAGSASSYTLWDLGFNLPLAPGAAQAMELGFNFELKGKVDVQQVSISNAGAEWVAGLSYVGASAQNYRGKVGVVYGPVPPFPSFDFLVAGDGWMWGPFESAFTIRHVGAAEGAINFIVAATAANASESWLSLTLVSVSLLHGMLPSGGLGIRIDETGLIIPVTEVPEPATALLMLGGLAALWGRRFRSAPVVLRVDRPGRTP